jgi:hypothetical protein
VTKSAPRHPSQPNGPATWPAQHCCQPVKCVNCIGSLTAPVSPSNHLGASQPVKSSRRQSAMQIISTAVSRANHLVASQPVKSSRRQSARQIISAPVSHANHRRPASQPPKSSWHTVGPPNDRTTTATGAVKDPPCLKDPVGRHFQAIVQTYKCSSTVPANPTPPLPFVRTLPIYRNPSTVMQPSHLLGGPIKAQEIECHADSLDSPARRHSPQT